MKSQTTPYLLTGILLLIQNTKSVEISQKITPEIIKEAISIVYGNPVFRKTICSEVKSSKLNYYLYTPENHKIGTRLDPEGQANNLTSFNPSLETKFITHGWWGKAIGSWPEDIKDTYLMEGNYNVILLDWSEYATELYSKSACYVTKVANITALLIVQLKKDLHLDLNKTHLIGHSLGGQMVGITGQFIQKFSNGEKVKRVTGLDAAGPLFCHPKVKDDDKRITADDAQFVDGIHTNDGQYGCSIQYAQSNFYPNCGKKQNGCNKVNLSLTNITGSLMKYFTELSCSHRRAYQFWKESILENDFSSRSCSSCLLFKLKMCSTNLENKMGEYTTFSKNGDYYLNTNSKEPYGLG